MQVRGEDHRETAETYNNLAYNLCKQGHYAKAEQLLRKAVKAMESSVGPQHPRSVSLRRNLEAFLSNRGGNGASDRNPGPVNAK